MQLQASNSRSEEHVPLAARDRTSAPGEFSHQRYGETQMTSVKTIAVAALLSMMAAAPALAQEAIQEPGAFAFYYPNLDVLNGGASTPAYRMEGMPPSVMQNYNERESGLGGTNVWYHGRTHHASSVTHEGRRHG
jgi:hypothetical protein